MVWKHALKTFLGHREKDAGDGADRQEEMGRPKTRFISVVRKDMQVAGRVDEDGDPLKKQPKKEEVWYVQFCFSLYIM